MNNIAKEKYEQINNYRSEQIKSYLSAINSLTKATEIVYCYGHPRPHTFEIRFKNDPFINTENHPLNVSDEFEKVNKDLFIKFFGCHPIYNNTHDVFWFYE